MSCLFHNRQYSSNVQRILNLLRVHIIKIKCDLNMIAKQSLCTCNSPNDTSTITDEELNHKQKTLENIKTQLEKSSPWPNEIDHLLHSKIMNCCESKISISKLLDLICDISNENKFRQLIQIPDDVNALKRLESHHRRRHPKFTHRHRIELSLPSSHIGHLLGRNGHRHKSIMKETETRIHFDNAPYSLPTKKRCVEFNLDVLQSSSTITATISGSSEDAIEQATKALTVLDRITQGKIAKLH